ncbi:MAG: nitroreductase family protein [Desulfobacterales bacterium]|nr:nitroreductase family protein [Desulfobacterales bacterium]
MENFKELVQNNRSCRRFDNDHKVSAKTLEELAGLTRYCASAANKQPLKYIVSATEAANEIVFDSLGWAAYLKDWPGPVAQERPTGYIIILGDHNIADKFWCDHGIAAQTILLGARAQGLAGCIFGAINIKKLNQAFDIPEHLEIKLVVAIGKPVETVQVEMMAQDGDYKYYRDEHQIHHVPKRSKSELLIKTV